LFRILQNGFWKGVVHVVSDALKQSRLVGQIDNLPHQSWEEALIMRSAALALTLTITFSVVCFAQNRDTSTNAEASVRAQQLLAKVREALGGESNLKQVRSLSLSGKYRRPNPTSEITGEIKIDLLAPDKFLKTEESNPQPLIFVTLLQAVNGDQVWVDRQVRRPDRDDGSAEIARGRSAMPSQIANTTTGMRNTAEGNTTARTTTPGSSRATERNVFGTALPTQQGRDRDNPMTQVGEASKASAQNRDSGLSPPGIKNPGVRSALETQLRKEFICLSLVWLTTTPASFPLELSYAGPIKTAQGDIEAIDLSGPEEFVARLFVDQTTSRPVMLSYGELVRKNTGYVVSAAGTDQTGAAKPEDLEEIAVQLYFSDYRHVNGVMFPFRISRAINGAPVDQWKIEKYKVNPDLKAKKFEKRG
jgi:hypothetical protein